MDNMIGKEIKGFKIEGELGEGGMGKVYKAFQASLERYVAIKTIPPSLARDPQLLNRFYTEAKSLARLNHPNIINVFDIFEIDNIHYIAMEYVEGALLGQLISRGTHKDKNKDEANAFFILKSLAEALVAAHDSGVIHRDIKPENIMISKDERIKLMDFGLARNTMAGSMTLSGHIMGTPEYMSPEQCEGKILDGRTDLYSLGITIFEILVGMTPFLSKSIGEIIHAKVYEESPKIQRYRPDISKSLAQIVNRLIENDICLRFQNARELLHDLQTQTFDPRTAPDKATIFTDSNMSQGSISTAVSDLGMSRGRATPTLRKFRNTLTRDIRILSRKELIWMLSVASVIMLIATWGVVKVKENVNLPRWLHSFTPLSDADKARIENLLREASLSFEGKQYMLALGSIEKILDIDVNNLEASELKTKIERIYQEANEYFEQGKKYILLNEREKAIQEFRKTIDIDPNFEYRDELDMYMAKAYNDLGAVSYKDKDYTEALRLYKEAGQWAPHNAVIMRNISLTASDLKQYEECIEYGRKAIEENPNPTDPDFFYYPLFYKIGNALLNLGRYDEAIEQYFEGIDKIRDTRIHQRFQDLISDVQRIKEEHQQAP